MSIEVVLTIVSLVVGAVVVFLLYRKRKNEKPPLESEERLTLETLLNKVKIELAELVKDDSTMGKTDLEWEAAYKRKKRLKSALKNCIYGIEADKIVVKDLIRDCIQKILPTEDDVARLIDFNNGNKLDPMYKWEVMMYFLKKKYKKNAMKYLISTYNWDHVRFDIEDGTVPHHLVTIKDLEFAYATEITRQLTYFEQLDVLATILFTKYKGFGCIDTLREQNVDGINIGTSGSIISAHLDVDTDLPRAPRSVWIYHDGKYIHLDYLTTETEEEMRRIILLICMYNNPGSLTEKRGYMVNTMYDKTRVLAIRPGAGEYWAVFLRKFNIKNVTLESLYIKPDDPENTTLPVSLIRWFMIGRVTCAFTGRQGTGKTTAMVASIAYIDARLTIRILEMAPEMYLRERYPDRNVYSVSETQYVSAAELQDALKKSDAAVSIVGEVATDAIAARMIQMGQVASLFTIFSHHANRSKDLVNAITNSIVASNGGGATAATVQPQVIDVIKIDVHMDFDVTGYRYFERITEIIPVDHVIPEYDPKDPVNSMNQIQRDYYEITAVGELFTTQDIVRFDRKTRKYIPVKWCSERLTDYMVKNIPTEQLPAFREFVTSNWEE